MLAIDFRAHISVNSHYTINMVYVHFDTFSTIVHVYATFLFVSGKNYWYYCIVKPVGQFDMH